MENKIIDTYKLIPKGTIFWSISNQTTISSDNDEIVQIKHTCYGNDTVFVKPMQLLFNIPGFIPTLIGKGTDEWELSLSKTKPYKKPNGKILT